MREKRELTKKALSGGTGRIKTLFRRGATMGWEGKESTVINAGTVRCQVDSLVNDFHFVNFMMRLQECV